MDDASVDTERSEFSKYLLDRVRQLEEKNLRLWEEYRRIESERRFAENQKIQYEREIRKLRSELERLKGPPLVVGTILDVLENEKVVIKSSTGPKFVVNTSQFIEGSDLLPGTRVALNQQTLAVVGVLSPPKDPTVYGMEIIESPSVDYDQIGGLEAQIQELKETVELPLIKPEAFAKVGIEPPKGVLLYGPPGSGKTLLAKAVAKRTEATFIRIVGSELVQKYIGEGARLVRELFEMAREKSPSIIFIDELDAIAAKRLESATSGDREVQRTLMQLLAEMDGFDPRGDVKVIAATNRPDILDPALLRPGRLDRMIYVPLPNFESRVEILKIHTRGMNLADEIDFGQIASATDGLSGADLSAIAMEAGMFAIRDGRESVMMSDFDKAVKKVLASAPKTVPLSDSGEMFA
ncbi:MAG: proteasome-activating nucleotidase [Methanocellales archaeon]|nr:proteasome-activating nucleotidase [Methanocellales archaeon]